MAAAELGQLCRRRSDLLDELLESEWMAHGCLNVAGVLSSILAGDVLGLTSGVCRVVAQAARNAG